MSWQNCVERPVPPGNKVEAEKIRKFLARFGLSFDAAVDYTVGFYRNDELVAVGSRAGEVLRNIAVEPALQGEGLTAAVLSHLIQEAARRGIYHYFIYTKPDTAPLFCALGFKEIARAEPYAVLLESGLGSIADHCKMLAAKVADLPPGPRAALVVNCNPFTLGHRAVIERAARENASVVVLVVEEDRSLFPFADRLRLVKEGVADLANVRVLPGGQYVISAATFPAYFTRGEEITKAQTRLDAEVFGKHIAPALGATRRYVGSEPYCAVTASYNEAMKTVLPEYGVEVVVMPRVEVDSASVSASRVRELIRLDDWDAIARLVPETTCRYLRSPENSALIERIKASQSRH
ncbi:[citrate (pro-3S)-lyase] ligase [Formivibrio citricus]|uniref:[Citrate [pro-3S]-lyase] ligase n=1 Tax=Formivibrio citricus TaxID=83765 RepID=A0A1I4VMX3_9NEIS|nr:[citrate (pro-3S)-lyase] ligase [Formivibrio citricus]SFN02584.1 [citrate (pro-3S)-lyase] ligase [Formivibrio citricus]